MNTDLGISPAVGVILLIGITAAVATIAGIVLLDVGENQQKVSAAGVDISETPEGVEVTWTDSGTAEQIQVLVDGEQITTLENVNETAVLGTPEGSTVSVVGVQDGEESTIRSEETTSDTTPDNSENTTVIESPGGASTVTGTVLINPPIDGAIVKSVKSDGSVIDTTTTNTDGEYTIEASSEDKIQVIVDGFNHNGTDHYLTVSEPVSEPDSEVNVDFGEVSTRSVTVNGESIEVSSGLSPDGFKLIGTVEQLQSISDPTAKYQLISDIDASETSEWNTGNGFVPLFKGSYKNFTDLTASDGSLKSEYDTIFTGVFDGNGHTISNLHVLDSIDQKSGFIVDTHSATIKDITFEDPKIRNPSGDESGSGLFTYTYNSEIRNITVTNPDFKGADYTGVISAYATASSSGVQIMESISISNANVEGGYAPSYSGNYDSGTGGVVGFLLFEDSKTANTKLRLRNVDVSGTISTEAKHVGGVVGMSFFLFSAPAYGNDSKLVDSNTDVTITTEGGKNSGGLIGYNTGLHIENSHSEGLIDSEGDNVGGLVGENSGGYLTDSYSKATVKGDQTVGGVVGDYSPANSYNTLTDSYAIGDVTANNVAGGLIGRIGSSAIVRRSYATGDVTEAELNSDPDPRFGGFVGSVYYGQVYNSYATGDVSGGKSGGFAGYNGDTIKNSYSTGEAKSGFIAKSYDGSEIVETDVYWNTESSGTSTTSGNAVGLTTSELQGESASSNLTGFDFDTVWKTTDKYPKLQD